MAYIETKQTQPSLIDTSSKFSLSFSKREFSKLRQGSVEAYFNVVSQALDKHTIRKAKHILRLYSEYGMLIKLCDLQSG